MTITPLNDAKAESLDVREVLCTVHRKRKWKWKWADRIGAAKERAQVAECCGEMCASGMEKESEKVEVYCK